LEFYRLKAVYLIASYLRNRKQRVVLQFVISPNLLLDWETDMVFLRDQCWVHYCSTCIFNDFPCII